MFTLHKKIPPHPRPPWMAPEIMTHKFSDTSNPYTRKSDVYAFGVVLFEIFTRELPFNQNGMQKQEILLWRIGKGMLKLNLQSLHDKIGSGSNKISSKENKQDSTEYKIVNLVSDCTQFKVEDRLTFKDVVERLTAIKEGVQVLRRANSFPPSQRNKDFNY